MAACARAFVQSYHGARAADAAACARFTTPGAQNAAAQRHLAWALSACRSSAVRRFGKSRPGLCKSSRFGSDQRELACGDFFALFVFCLWKQITAIILAPWFPGWTAPLTFDPLRFGEFIGFTVTLCGTWAACAFLTGDYSTPANGIRGMLVRTCRTWTFSMPVVASQLVLATAAESGSLVVDDAFALKLPLVASGLGEPLVSAAGVLGTMLIWRTWYVAFVDLARFKSFDAARVFDRSTDEAAWHDGVKLMALLAGASVLLVAAWPLQHLVPSTVLLPSFSAR